MQHNILDFEKPIVELENKIEELQHLTESGELDLSSEIGNLQKKLARLKKETYEKLTPWQRVLIARHPRRPYTYDYISLMVKNFIELHGDRAFADDKALVGGLGTIGTQKVMICGHQKGKDIKENLYRNFGSAHPEGYRKALRFMKMAEKFSLPLVCLIDTPGAYPGIGAEERGQALAIADNLLEFFKIKTPIVVVVIGEGGSGGALGIGIGDRVYIMENAYYSVISPEGCAAILWKDRARAPEAAQALKLTGPDLKQLGIIDDIIPEPLGGAHRDPERAAELLQETILAALSELKQLSIDDLLEARYQKFRRMGVFQEDTTQ
ncbi:MAG: acetyl-CoA carboxylase carboxyltransferase subunit alpha [Candidatus Omnitrophica bacterium]|nr:acetyl-CoA carboxylase carboxyltransferase subunit alpha [Candidatus Omnitrophota bacterium]